MGIRLKRAEANCLFLLDQWLDCLYDGRGYWMDSAFGFDCGVKDKNQDQDIKRKRDIL